MFKMKLEWNVCKRSWIESINILRFRFIRPGMGIRLAKWKMNNNRIFYFFFFFLIYTRYRRIEHNCLKRPIAIVCLWCCLLIECWNVKNEMADRKKRIRLKEHAIFTKPKNESYIENRNQWIMFSIQYTAYINCELWMLNWEHLSHVVL